MADILPPDRLSLNDPDYSPELGRRLTIWLDGVKQDAVISYDRVEGTIERYLRKDGSYVLNTKGNQAEREVVRGTVTVEFREPTPAS